MRIPQDAWVLTSSRANYLWAGLVAGMVLVVALARPALDLGSGLFFATMMGIVLLPRGGYMGLVRFWSPLLVAFVTLGFWDASIKGNPTPILFQTALGLFWFTIIVVSHARIHQGPQVR
jgi:hypothetical protein